MYTVCTEHRIYQNTLIEEYHCRRVPALQDHLMESNDIAMF